MDKDLQQRAQKAIQAGIDPKLVQSRLAQIQSIRNSQSVSNGNFSSPNLVENNGIVGNLVNSVARPFVKTGQTIGGSVFEVARALAARAGNKDAYATQNGQAVIQNPFLSQKQIENPTQVLGDQVKNSAAIASYGVPIGGSTSLFGKTLTSGAFTGGAIAGGLQSLGDQNVTPGSVVTGALTGGVVGKGLELAGKAAGKLGKAGDALESAGTDIRTGNVTLKATKGSAAEEKAIKQTFEKYGIKGTPDVRFQMLDPKIEAIGNKIQADLALNPQKVPSMKSLESTFLEKAKPSILQGSVTKEEALQGFRDWVDQVKSVSPDAFTSSDKLFELKKTFQGGIPSTFKKANAGGTLTATQKADKAIRDTLDSVVSTLNPEVKQLTMDQSRLIAARPATSAARKTVPTIRALGITIPKGPANAAVDTLGKTAEAAGKTLNAATLWPGVKMPSTIRQVLPRLVNVIRGISGQGQGVLPQDQSTQLPSGGDILDSGASATSKNNPYEITPEVVKAAYFVLPKAKADVIKQIYDIQNSGAPKTTSTAALKIQNLSTSGVRGLKDAAQIFQQDPNIVLKGTVSGGLLSRQYDSAIGRAVEALLRARSGAAVPKQERDAYVRQFTPQVGDSYDVATYKLQQLYKDLQDLGNTGSANVVDYPQLQP